MFYGIDGHFAPPNYLMNGFSRTDKTMLIYNMGQQGGNTCLEIKNIAPIPIDMADVAHLATFNVLSNGIIFSAKKSSEFRVNIIIDCSN